MNIQLSAVEVVALLRDFQLGRVRAKDGRTYAFDAQTVGLRWDVVHVGQRLRCVLCLEPRRVLIVSEISLLDLRGMLTPQPGSHVELDEMSLGFDALEQRLDSVIELARTWIAEEQVKTERRRLHCLLSKALVAMQEAADAGAVNAERLWSLISSVQNELDGWIDATEQQPRPGQRITCRNEFGDWWTETYSERQLLGPGVLWRPEPAV